MTDDLVQRLRSSRPIPTIPHEAADRIEAQAAEIERLKNKLSVETEPSPYCPICGSCGDEGCCGSKRCLYPDTGIEALKAEIEQWRACARYDATMEGPAFKGWDMSALERCRRAALQEQSK